MIKIAIVGATGRMGKAICRLIANQSNHQPHHQTNSPQSNQKNPKALEISFVCSKENIGQNLGALIGIHHLTLPIHENIEQSLIDGVANFDVLIDFTAPKATLAHLEFCKKQQKPMVIGTTGFSADEEKIIRESAKIIPIVFAPNMSIGVNLMFKTVEFLASTLDESFDAEIIEAHHNKKVDSPSGTALKIGQIIAKARKVDFEAKKTSRGFGVIGERKVGEIGFSAIRGGDIIGEHRVLFATEGEVIELTHKSSSRTNYAKGALLAASFLAEKNQTESSGLFDMFDVLNLKKFQSL